VQTVTNVSKKHAASLFYPKDGHNMRTEHVGANDNRYILEEGEGKPLTLKDIMPIGFKI
jgi:glucan-binding YG repeat protein